MNEMMQIIIVNSKKDYHNCEMIFSFYYKSDTSDFNVQNNQKYNIHTTIKEIEALNEALNVFQSNSFKEQYLLYSEQIDGSIKYPEFKSTYEKSKELALILTKLSNDEDRLDQLTNYCMQIAPTYDDDFKINKKIESIIIDKTIQTVNGYDDLKEYIAKLKIPSKHLFV